MPESASPTPKIAPDRTMEVERIISGANGKPPEERGGEDAEYDKGNRGDDGVALGASDSTDTVPAGAAAADARAQADQQTANGKEQERAARRLKFRRVWREGESDSGPQDQSGEEEQPPGTIGRPPREEAPEDAGDAGNLSRERKGHHASEANQASADQAKKVVVVHGGSLLRAGCAAQPLARVRCAFGSLFGF